MTLLPPSGSCQAIHSDQITGEDLGRALPAFGRIPHDAMIANAPPPEGQRIFAWPELQRIGRQFGVELPSKSRICFEWQMRPVGPDDVRAAMRESLQSQNVRIDVLAIGKSKAPEGKLVFPLSGLSASTNVDATTPVSWRGEVIYDSSHRFTVWARVRLAATMTRVVAKELLLPGQTVTAPQIALETVDDFPLRGNLTRSLEQVIGHAPLRAIKPGAPVMRADLAEPLQVRRGESVLVTAVSGGAQLRMEAVAENSGKQGEMISLRNPRSGRSFRARIEGKDQALVIAGPVAVLTGVP
ncbi:MAG TPA: flagellar basal body P-ring formation chaperone FlgA [Bryobacteraceae bacterium]|nr:flagellar basal body P-ring formation chaperone FlgA [Bryobacteraceae bacterium]